jgi:arabinofuranosyltransferase
MGVKKQKNNVNVKSSKPFNTFLNKYLAPIILLCIISYFVYLCINIRFVQDDTYITLQYAKNFATGNGLVFNIGEKVEGFTSLIWVMILGFAYKIGLNIESLSQILSVTFGAINLFLIYILFKEIAQNSINTENEQFIGKVFALLSVLITALSGTYYYWAVSGMETTLFTMFFLITIYFYLKYYLNGKLNILLPVFVFTTSLIRPEGNVLIILILTHFSYTSLINNHFSISKSLKIIFSKEKVKGYSVFIFLVLGITVFRISYFGYPLPNTFYAKTSFSVEQIKVGIEYFLSFASDYLFYGFILILPLYLFRYKDKRGITSFLYLNTFVFIVYTILVGGDVLTQFRFFVPIIPLVAILFCFLMYSIYTSLKEAKKKMSLPMLLIFPFMVAIFINLINTSVVKKMAERENDLVYRMEAIGKWLQKELNDKKEKLSIAASTVGALKYYSGIDVIDMLGLTDSFIAHNPNYIKAISDEKIGWKEKKYNARYILDRKPNYILFSTQEKPSSYAERALFLQTEFYRNYFVYLYDPNQSKIYQSIYKRVDDSLLLNKDTINHNLNYSVNYISLYIKVQNLTTLKKIDINQFIDNCKKLIKISPSYFGDPYRLLAWIYLQTGDKEEAVKYARTAIGIDGINLKASIILISAYLGLNEFDKAEAEILNIEKMVPQIARSFKQSLLRKKDQKTN